MQPTSNVSILAPDILTMESSIRTPAILWCTVSGKNIINQRKKHLINFNKGTTREAPAFKRKKESSKSVDLVKKYGNTSFFLAFLYTKH